MPGNSPRWLSMGGIPGTNRPVYCSTVDSKGNLYVGGEFTTVDDRRSFGVAKWDGIKWTSISPPTANGQTVEALATDSAGNLYVGGSFRDFGGVNALRIARWDGKRWHAMGAGLGFNGTAHSQKVKAIAVSPSGVVYAGGVFTESNGVTVNNIARWDGNLWQPVGTGFNGGSLSDVVNAMTFDSSGNLYVTGRFSYFGDNTQVNRIAKWDGTSWSALGTGLTGFPETPHGSSLIIDGNGNLIVGGEFKFAGGVQVNNIALWNGVAWSAFGAPGAGAGFTVGSANGVRALRLSTSGEIFAASSISFADGFVFYQLMRWNGSAWVHAIPYGAKNGEIRTFEIMPNGDLILGGGFLSMGSGTNEFHASHLVRWDGARFHRFGNGPDGEILAARFDSNNDLIVAGNFRTIGGINASRIARFDGTRWWPYGTGLDDSVYALELGPNGVLYAGGKFLNAGGVASRCIAKWDGSQWVSMAGGLTQTGTVPQVNSIVMGSNGNLFVAGLFANSVSGVTLSGIARWQNDTWYGLDGGCRTLDGTPRNGRVERLLIDPQGALLACGYFERMGSGTGNTGYLARWNGTLWSPIGPTNDTQRPFANYVGVNTMAFSPEGVLHVAYNNTITNGHSLVRLISNTWSTLGNGFSGKPYSIVFDDDGGIFAGGTLSLTGQSPHQVLRGIAYWNGERWSSYGNEGLGMVNLTGTETVEVRTMVRDNRNNLIVGGKFLGSQSGVVSPYLIRSRMGGYGTWSTLGALPPQQLDPQTRNGPFGIPNLLAYAMALNPLTAQSQDLPQLLVADEMAAPIARSSYYGPAPAESNSSQVLKFRYRWNPQATGISTQVEISTDLVAWNPAEIISSEILENHADWQLVEVTVPRPPNIGFIRLAADFIDNF